MFDDHAVHADCDRRKHVVNFFAGVRPQKCILLLLCLLVASCSSRFFYERVDWFVVWKVDSYVNLSGEQKDALQTDVQAYLDDVRVNEMPLAAAMLREVARKVDAKEMNAAAIDASYDESMLLFEEVALGVIPVSQRFLMGLNEDQIDELLGNFTEANDEMYEEYSGRTPEEREKNRNKSSVKSIEEFTGRLSADQKAMLKERLATMADSSEQWIDYQRQWQERFRTLISSRPPEAEYTAQLTELFIYPRSFHSPEYRAKVEGNRQIFNVMMDDLLQSLTDKQRKRVVSKLTEYAETLDRLAAS